jgi:DNA-binding transcriptional regulator YdaS (Cro superfamily)
VKTVQTLISIAREKVHTDRELADALGIDAQTLNAMKKGRRAVSPEAAAAMCEVAGVRGDEARQYIAAAIVENAKNAPKAAMLKRVLFGLGAASVALLLQAPNDARARTAVESPALADRGAPLYIMSTIRRLLARLRQSLQRVPRLQAFA